MEGAVDLFGLLSGILWVVRGELTVARKAFGVTTALAEVGTLTLWIRLTISPSRISLVASSRRRSSAVTPFAFRSNTVRFPSASASRKLSEVMCATAVAQAVAKWRAISVRVAGRPVGVGGV